MDRVEVALIRGRPNELDTFLKPLTTAGAHPQ